jgi:O-antigen/teichoic acid export membrane protein
VTSRPPFPTSRASTGPQEPTGRTDPEPPTVRLDPVEPVDGPTVRLPSVVADTVRIPGVSPANGQGGDAPPGGLHDGLALALSSVLGSLAGFLSWLIAARIMTTSEVGDAQLVVSAFILVGGAAQLNLGVGLMRWVPQAGRSTGRLVWSSLLLIMPLSGLVGLVYALIAPRLAAISAGAGMPIALGMLVFVLACAGWGVFVVHDFVLVALHKPWWAVWRNGVFAVVRISLLVVLGGIAGLGAYGIVLSWVGPIVVWVVVGSVVIALLTRRVSRRSSAVGALPGRTAALAFLGPTAVAQLGAALLYNQVPLVVNLRFGADTGAVFFIAWQAVTVIDLAGTFFMNSLAVGVAREPARAAELAAAARRRLLMIFVPLLAIGAALATPVLLIFGEAYAQADNVLRLLLLGLAFRLVVVHELGVRQAAGKAMSYARLQLISTVLVLAAAVLTPVTGGGVSALLPVAVGYVVVQVLCVVGVMFSPARRRADVEVPSP